MAVLGSQGHSAGCYCLLEAVWNVMKVLAEMLACLPNKKSITDEMFFGVLVTLPALLVLLVFLVLFFFF